MYTTEQRRRRRGGGSTAHERLSAPPFLTPSSITHDPPPVPPLGRVVPRSPSLARRRSFAGSQATALAAHALAQLLRIRRKKTPLFARLGTRGLITSLTCATQRTRRGHAETTGATLMALLGNASQEGCIGIAVSMYPCRGKYVFLVKILAEFRGDGGRDMSDIPIPSDTLPLYLKENLELVSRGRHRVRP